MKPLFAKFLVTQWMNCGMNIGTKRGVVNENSSMLWHRCLGQMQRQDGEVGKGRGLHTLNFTLLFVLISISESKSIKLQQGVLDS